LGGVLTVCVFQKQFCTTLLASNAGDFGGYTIPIIGLALLGATIGILAGPVED